MSRPDLRACYVSILVWSGCDFGGHSMFFFLCFCISLFWPGMVLNQGQLSIVVSEWEPYLGSFFHTMFLWLVHFCLVFCNFQDCFGYSPKQSRMVQTLKQKITIHKQKWENRLPKNGSQSETTIDSCL